MFKILSTYSCWKKYIQCNIWRVAICPSYILGARFLKVNICEFPVQQSLLVTLLTVGRFEMACGFLEKVCTLGVSR
jgi:hypothetical protein